MVSYSQDLHQISNNKSDESSSVIKIEIDHSKMSRKSSASRRDSKEPAKGK